MDCLMLLDYDDLDCWCICEQFGNVFRKLRKRALGDFLIWGSALSTSSAPAGVECRAENLQDSHPKRMWMFY